MGEAKRNRDRWDEAIAEAQTLIMTAPQEIRDFFARMNEEMADLGDEHQIPPRQMAVAAAGMVGALCLVEVLGDINDNDGIDDFLHYADAAMHVAMAKIRLERGLKFPSEH